jgi:tetratricopeptide (TPR) repeat protein
MISKTGRRQRPKPSKISRVKPRIKDVLKHFTLKRVALAVLVLPFLLYIYREVSRDALIMDPFSVPKGFEDRGLTSEVVSNRIGNTVREIEMNVLTRMKKDNLSSLHDEGSIPEVEIPGTKLGLKAVVEGTRAILGIYPKHVSGDIVVLGSDASKTGGSQVKVTVYITQGRNRSQSVTGIIKNDNDIDGLIQNSAEIALAEINPYVLAAYKYDHGKVKDALEIVERMIRDPSQDRRHVAAAINFRGLVFSDQKNYAEAVAKYQEALETDPKFALAYYNWGNLLYEQKKYSEAADKFQKSAECDSKYAYPYLAWGNMLREQGMYKEAAAKYEKATKADPGVGLAYDNWGVVLADQKDYDAAAAKFLKASEIEPTDALVYYNWAVMLRKQNKWEDAASKYQKATEFDPKTAVSAFFDLGTMFAQQNKYEEAISKFEKAIEIDENFIPAYLNWGILLVQQNKLDEASSKFKKVTEIDPNNTDGYANWGMLLANQNRFDEAAAKFKKVTEIDPKNANAYNSLGRIFKAQKKDSEADQAFRKAGELSK